MADTSDKRARAEAQFARKQKAAADATGVWADVRAREKALDANTARLKALRLARDAEEAAAAPPPPPAPAPRKRKPKA